MQAILAKRPSTLVEWFDDQRGLAIALTHFVPSLRGSPIGQLLIPEAPREGKPSPSYGP